MSIIVRVAPLRTSKRTPGSTMKLIGIPLMAAVILAALTIGLFGLLQPTEARTETEPVVLPVPEAPLVRFVAAKQHNARFTVRAEGTVIPARESQLSALAAGAIVEVSPKLVVGGFFNQGDVLVRLDSQDYELAVTRAALAIEQAKLRLQIEEQQAAVARAEWDLVGEGEASPLALHEPQLAVARTDIEVAEAALRQARLDLDRTVVQAPYAGRVRQKLVDLGHVVQRGAPLASIYSTNVAEVRLAIPDSELAFLDLPDGDTGASLSSAPAVTLEAMHGGTKHSWNGRLVRTEGEIDTRTGGLYAIAQVQNPYRPARSGATPLALGMYVEAAIAGRWVRAVEIPTAALTSDSRILVVDADDRINRREVEILRVEGEVALVRGGLSEGERVCISVPSPVVDGMRVRVERP